MSDVIIPILKSVMAEPGVADLPYTVRGFFAKALIEERTGNNEQAAIFLNKAVELEQKSLNIKV